MPLPKSGWGEFFFHEPARLWPQKNILPGQTMSEKAPLFHEDLCCYFKYTVYNHVCELEIDQFIFTSVCLLLDTALKGLPSGCNVKL